MQEQLERGFELLQHNRHDEAIRAFKKADKLSEGTLAQAVVGLSLAFSRVGAHANAERTARRALELADKPEDLLQTRTVLGIAIYNRAGDDKGRLEEAEAVFRTALELSGGDSRVIKFNLGEVLLKLGRDDEGLDFLEEYLSTDPTGPMAAHARSLVDDPRRARENLAPDFSLVTLDGEYLTPGDLVGKVVLLDFWGTWCAPCRNSTPHMRKLHRRYRDKPFVLISVSTDSDREVLVDYIEEQQMEWLQVWDERRTISHDSFRVRTFPTFVIIDHEGRLAFRRTGWGQITSTELDREVGRAVRQAEKAATD